MNERIMNVLETVLPGRDLSIPNFSEILDSSDVVLLTVALEKEFKVKIDGMAMRKENFKDIESIKKLIDGSLV